MLVDSDLNEKIIYPFIPFKEKNKITMSYGLEPIGYTLRYANKEQTILPDQTLEVNIFESLNVPKDYRSKVYIKSSYMRKGVVLLYPFIIKNISNTEQKLYPMEGMFQVQFHKEDEQQELDTLLHLNECDAPEMKLSPYESCLVSTSESIQNSNDCCMEIIPFTQNKFRIFVAAIDPGYNGNLTYRLYNESPETIYLTKDMCIGQIVKTKLEKLPGTSYNGKYQNSQGMVYAKID